MAIQEKHEHNWLSWHFRKNSGLKEISANTFDGFFHGVTWGSGDNASIGLTIGAACSLMTVIGSAVVLDGTSYPLHDPKFQDDSLSYYTLDNNDGISYSIVISFNYRTI